MAEDPELAELSRRLPDPGREAFHSNQYYGFDLWLKAHAGWPSERPLKVIHPHGVVFSARTTSREEVQAHLPMVAAYPDFRMASYRLATPMRVVPGAAPFLYAVRALDKGPSETDPRGTLFFPSHSSAEVVVSEDDAALVQDLDALADRLRPITVCVYWADIELERHLPYIDAGYRVVTCGHRNRADFTDRLWELLRGHEYVAGSGLGSHLFYAAAAGRDVFWLNPERTLPRTLDRYLGPGRELLVPEVPQHVVDEARSHLLEVLRVFGVPEPPSSQGRQDQQRIARYYLGAENMLEPSELRRLFDEAERLDRRPIRSASGRIGPPPVLQRSIDSVERRVHRLIRRIR